MTEHDRILRIIQLKRQMPANLDPRTSALLIVDVQRYFVHAQYSFVQTLEKLVPECTLGYVQRVKSTVLPNIQRLQARFRALRLPVIYTATGSQREDARDLPGWLKEFDELSRSLVGEPMWPLIGDPRWHVDDSVAPQPDEIVLAKTSSGPLSTTGLEATLRNLGIGSLVVTGLTTDVCVTQTARETADRGFHVVVAEDACTTLSNEMHAGALQAFALAFGRVRTTDEILALLTDIVDEVRQAPGAGRTPIPSAP